MFTWIHKNDWFRKKATFVRSKKVEMISTFQRNQHFRKVPVIENFAHVQEQKKAISPGHLTYIPSICKNDFSCFSKHSIGNVWQGSKYASGSEYTRVLNVSLVLNVPELWICQIYTEFGIYLLNSFWIFVNMREYA